MFNSATIYIGNLFLFVLSLIVVFLLIRISYFRKLSETDRMTSLMNYHGMCRKIDQLRKHKIPFSLVIVDIDNFKIFNEHSYKLGDDVLKEFAGLIKNTFHEQALLSRFRIGDEFIIVFQNKNLNETKHEIDKFKEVCTNHHFKCLKDFSIHSINFSEGYSEYNATIDSIEKLFSEAEKLLKKNKSQKFPIYN
ncbi:MAG TPA: GGDEF domain-containing protein [Bacteroidales bacterium]|nr:GGDEF domain-containing protein [Bacteroidales bacterium]HPS17477.1 GGDEF domain-containing protein [Bacteroidales bacterium]